MQPSLLGRHILQNWTDGIFDRHPHSLQDLQHRAASHVIYSSHTNAIRTIVCIGNELTPSAVLCLTTADRVLLFCGIQQMRPLVSFPTMSSTFCTVSKRKVVLLPLPMILFINRIRVGATTVISTVSNQLLTDYFFQGAQP